MIEIQNLNFSFGKNTIFKNLSVKFEKGKLYGIIGANGSGKTTLLKLITRHLTQDSGQIYIDQTPINNIPRLEFAKKIAVLPQEKSKVSISVYDHIASGRYPFHGTFGLLSKYDKQIIEECAETAGVTALLRENIRNLSGGERQKVYIATVLAQNTPYIILDEPTTYLDVSARFGMMALMKKVCENGKGIIAVIHDLSLALKYCDFILVLDRKHNYSKMMPPLEACDTGIIEAIFNIRCISFDVDGKKEFIISEK